MFYVSLTLEIKNEKIMWNIKWALRSDDGNDFQSLIEIFWGFLSQAKMEQCFQKEKKILKLLWKDLVKQSKDTTALPLEHSILSISIFIGNLLPDVKK